MRDNLNPHNKKFEVGIIGLGNIGSAVAHYLFSEHPDIYLNIYSRSYHEQEKGVREQRLREITFTSNGSDLDRVRMFRSIDGELNVEGEKRRLFDSDVIVYCARNQNVPFSDFRDRDDEYFANFAKLKEDAEKLRGYKKGVVLVATNPLELTAETIARISGIDKNRIVGGSYIDTSRFRSVLSEQLHNLVGISVSPEKLEGAVVIGEHGAGMVPIYSLIRIGGKKFLKHPKLKGKVREKINHAIKTALIEGPTKFQTEDENPMRNVRVPSKALLQTILAIRDNYKIPTTVYSDDSRLTGVEECFITNMCQFGRLEDWANGITIAAEAKSDFLSYISSSEREKYISSKKDLVRRINFALKGAVLK